MATPEELVERYNAALRGRTALTSPVQEQVTTEAPQESRFVTLAKQLAAGVTETFLPSPQAGEELGTVGDVLPSFIWDLASLPAMLDYGIRSAELPGGGATYDTAIDSVFGERNPFLQAAIDTPVRYAQSTRERANELIGIGDPENLGESLARMISIPLPIFRGRAVSEGIGMVLPLGQARTAPGIILEQALPGFLDAVIRNEIDPLYNTSGQARIERMVELYNATQVDNSVPLVPRRTGDVYADLEIPEDESGQTGLYVLGALATVLGAGGVSAAGAAMRRARYDREVVQASEFMGPSSRLETRSELVSKPSSLVNEGPIADRTIIQRVADRNAPMEFVVNHLTNVSEKTREVLNSWVDVIGSAHGRAGNVSTVLQNGGDILGVRIPNATAAYRILSQIPPQKQREYLDVLRALDLEDVMRVAGKTDPADVWSGSLTYSRIQAIARSAPINDPQFIQLRSLTQQMSQALVDLRVRTGTMTAADAMAVRVKYPNYIPLQLALENPREVKKIGAATRQVGAVEAKEMRNPVDDLVFELDRLAQNALSNELRRGILAFGSRHMKLAAKNGKNVIERGAPTKKEEAAGARHSWYMSGGKRFDFTVWDSSLYNALTLSPNFTAPLLNTLRKWHQQFTTGYFAPLFALTSAQFDVVATALLRRKGEGTGLLDQLTRTAIGKPLSSVLGFDPSILLSPITGGIVGTALDTMAAIRDSIARSLVKDGAIVSILGRANAVKFAGIITSALEKSFVYKFNKYAGNAPDIVTDFSTGSRSIFSDAEYQRGGPLAGLRYNPLTRAAKVLIRNIQNGTRIQHALANRPLQLKQLNIQIAGRSLPLRYYAPSDIEADWLIQMAKTRRSNVDVAQVGFDPNTKLGRFGQGVVSSIPYANHSIRAAAEHIRAMRENPTGYFMTMAGISTGLVMYLIETTESNPEFAQFFWHDMTSTQRTMGVPFLGEAGEVAALVAHAPELRIVLGPLTEVIGTLMGYKTADRDLNLVDGVTDLRTYLKRAYVPGWEERDSADLGQSLMRGFGSVNPLSFPGIFGSALSALGVQPPEVNLGRFGAQAYPDIRGQPELDSDAIRGFEGVMEGLIGATSQPLMAMVHSLIGSARFDDTTLGEDVLRGLSAFVGSYDDPRKYTVLSSLFDAEYRLSVADNTWHTANNKLRALTELLGVAREYIDNPGTTRMRAPGTLLAEMDLTETELASVMDLLKGAESEVGRIVEDISTIKDQRAELPFASTIGEGGQTSTSDRDIRTSLDNSLARRSRYLHTYLLDVLRGYEENISSALGRSFVFGDSALLRDSVAEATRASHPTLPTF